MSGDQENKTAINLLKVLAVYLGTYAMNMQFSFEKVKYNNAISIYILVHVFRNHLKVFFLFPYFGFY